MELYYMEVDLLEWKMLQSTDKYYLTIYRRLKKVYM